MPSETNQTSGRQTVLFDVGDIVRPLDRWSHGYYSKKYSTLNYGSTYRVISVRTHRRGTHQLIEVDVYKKGGSYSSDQSGSSSPSGGYDGRNFRLENKGDGSVDIKGTAKKQAHWIIIDSSNGNVVGSIPLTEQPRTDPYTEESIVMETATYIGNAANAMAAEAYTESLVDAKIAELLRKSPEGSYMAFKHVKTGKLPILPVEWLKA